MNKKAMALLLVLAMIIMSLAACGGSKAPTVSEQLTAATDNIFASIKKDYESVTDKITPDDIRDLLTEENFLCYSSIKGWVSNANEKLEYTITEIDEEDLTVDVDCTYVDSSDFLDKAMEEMISAFSDLFSDEGLSDFDFEKEGAAIEFYNTIFEKAIEKSDADSKITKSITISFEKDGDSYVLAEDNDDLYDIANAGLYYLMNSEDPEGYYEGDYVDYDDLVISGQIYYEVEPLSSGKGALVTIFNDSYYDCGVDIEVTFMNPGEDDNIGWDYMGLVPAESSKNTIIYNMLEEFEALDVVISASMPSDWIDLQSYIDCYVSPVTEDDVNYVNVEMINNSPFEMNSGDFTIVFYNDGMPLDYAADFFWEEALAPGESYTSQLCVPYDWDTMEQITYEDCFWFYNAYNTTSEY